MLIQKGDLVQIEIDGCLCLEKPEKVIDIVDFKNEKLVFY
jgi:hypothetical protein